MTTAKMTKQKAVDAINRHVNNTGKMMRVRFDGQMNALELEVPFPKDLDERDRDAWRNLDAALNTAISNKRRGSKPLDDQTLALRLPLGHASDSVFFNLQELVDMGLKIPQGEVEKYNAFVSEFRNLQGETAVKKWYQEELANGNIRFEYDGKGAYPTAKMTISDEAYARVPGGAQDANNSILTMLTSEHKYSFNDYTDENDPKKFHLWMPPATTPEQNYAVPLDVLDKERLLKLGVPPEFIENAKLSYHELTGHAMAPSTNVANASGQPALEKQLAVS